MMTEFVSDVKAGRHSEQGWPNTCYGMSKLGLIAYTNVRRRGVFVVFSPLRPKTGTYVPWPDRYRCSCRRAGTAFPVDVVSYAAWEVTTPCLHPSFCFRFKPHRPTLDADAARFLRLVAFASRHQA